MYVFNKDTTSSSFNSFTGILNPPLLKDGLLYFPIYTSINLSIPSNK